MVQLNGQHIFSDLDSSELTIREALDVEEQSWHQLISQSEFRIPEYQRNYSWETSHRDDFYSTLKDSFVELQPIPNDLDDMSEVVGLYMGGIYVAVPGNGAEHEQLDIVDGQQRLATFQLLLNTLYDYCNNLESEADEEGDIKLKAELSEIKTELDSSFSGTDPSVVMNSEDIKFFKALAAYPGSWEITVRDVLKNQLEEGEDDGLDGRMRPRVKTVGELIDMIQGPIQTSSDYDLKEEQPFAPVSTEDDDGNGDGEDGNNGGDEEGSGSKLNKFIRFETSHERMFDAYKEAYALIENLHDELTNGELEQRANVTMNFSSFILHGVIVDRCLITEPEPDLRLDIFQSINDKGRPLHNVDKIRARIKHRLVGEDDSGPMDEWRKTLARHGGDKDTIEDMLAYFVASTEDGIDDISDARNELMNVFNRSVSEDSSVSPRLTSDNTKDLVTNVSEYSKYYHDIKNGTLRNFSRGIDDSSRQEIKRILDRVGTKIGATQWYALGPWMYLEADKNAPDGWDDEDVGEFLFDIFDAIEVVSLRQSISERSGAAIEGAYVETVQNFRDRDSSERFNSSEIVADLADTVRDKSGDLFEDGLIDHFVKNRNWTSGSTAQCVLQRTTSRYLAENDPELSVRDYSGVQIEHILPQSPISNQNNRTEADDASEYAWLEYFFKTYEDGDQPISEATQLLIDEEVPSLNKSDIETEGLTDGTNQDQIEQIQEEIYKRFVDDIANLLLLVEKDNIENSNDLFSKKLPAYSKDEYIPVVVNDFFKRAEDSDFASADDVLMQREDFEELNSDEPELDESAAGRVDKSWNFEVMFQRKADMIYKILQHLTFNLDPDTGDSDESSSPNKKEFNGLQEQVKESVEDDRERRIRRRAF